MQDYFYIKEQLETFNFEKKLLRLSKALKNKKVVVLGTNSTFKAITESFELNEYFNIVGILDLDNKGFENTDNEKYRILSVENLFFSGIDFIFSIKGDAKKIEKYFKENRLIKKKVKVIDLIEKPLFEKLKDFLSIGKNVVDACKKTGKIMPAMKCLFSYNYKDVNSQLNYLKRIYDLKSDTIKPIRILFIVFDYKSWALNDLYFKLRNDENFKVLPIVVLPNNLNNKEYSSLDETMTYLNKKGYSCINGIEQDTGTAVIIQALKPDIIIYQQPELMRADYTPNELSNYALTCYIEPHFEIKKTDSVSKFVMERLNKSWKVFASNNYSLKTLKNTVDAGCILFEKYYKNPAQNYENLWINFEDNNVKRIVYSPTINTNENIDIDKILGEQKFMLEFAKVHPNFSFVFIPEKNFKKRCIDKGIMDITEYDAYINNWSKLSNATVKNNIEAIPVYQTSDVLLTNSLAAAIEYFPSGNPIIYIGEIDKYSLNKLGEKICKTFYKLPSLEPIEIVLDDLLIGGNDYSFKERYSILGKESDYFDKKTSDIIIENIKEELERTCPNKEYISKTEEFKDRENEYITDLLN